MSEYKAPDHFLVDDLLSDEHKIIRQSVRDWIDREFKPIIEDHFEKATFPHHLLKEMGR